MTGPGDPELRALLPEAAHGARPPTRWTLERSTLPTVGPLRVAGRLFTWTWAGLRFAADRAGDRLAGRSDVRTLAVRVRELFERVGGTALKLGQQLAVRVDLLPFEVCAELGALLDSAAPVPLDEARRLVEDALGEPVDTVFAAFGETVLGSASIATVYGCRLTTGERVAVKVRRPGVAEKVVADLRVVALLTTLAEQLTLVRPGHFHDLRGDLWTMLTDELDFRKEADFQMRFRQLAARDRLRWLTAPDIVGALSSETVMVSEWVEGVACGALVDAVDRADADQLAAYAAMDIAPDVVAKRVFRLSQWGRLECPFFQADPHPGNLIVQPGSRLVVLDFGSCGATSGALQDQLTELSKRLLDEDFHGATAVSLAMLSPLPFFDLEALRARLERALWKAHLPSLFADAAWWERTSVWLWLTIAEVTRDFQIPSNPDMLRGVRASLLYDTLAYRLDPELDRLGEFRRWVRRSARRARRRLRAEERRRGEAVVERDWRVLRAELGEVAEKGQFAARELARSATVDFRALRNAVGYAVAQLLHLGTLGLVVVAVVATGLWVYSLVTGHVVTLAVVLTEAVGHPVVWAIAAFLAWIWYRRIVYRLRAREVTRA